jgi:hypothetical protein
MTGRVAATHVDRNLDWPWCASVSTEIEVRPDHGLAVYGSFAVPKQWLSLLLSGVAPSPKHVRYIGCTPCFLPLCSALCSSYTYTLFISSLHVNYVKLRLFQQDDGVEMEVR